MVYSKVLAQLLGGRGAGAGRAVAQLEARVVQLEVSGAGLEAVTIIDWVIVIKVSGTWVLDSVHVWGGGGS